MIKTTVHDLLTGDVCPPYGEYIYIICSDNDVMYVGKTNDPARRIEQHYASTFLTFSLDNKRDVRGWTVEIRTVEECREYIPAEYKRPDFDMAEISTIQALRPVLNATYNTNPSPMPERYKRLFVGLPVGITDNLY